MRVLTLILVTAILAVLPEAGIAGDPDNGNRGPAFREIIGTGGDDANDSSEIIGTGGDNETGGNEIIGTGGDSGVGGTGRIEDRSFWFWRSLAWFDAMSP